MRAVLIAEEHERAHLLCIFERDVAMMNKWYRLTKFLVDEFFDSADLFVRYFLIMREVKTQLLLVHERTCLMYMLAENLAKRRVHKMCCAVVALDVASAYFINAAMSGCAFCDIKFICFDNVCDRCAAGK